MKLILIGYSGHGCMLVEAALESGNIIAGYFEKQEKVNNPYNLKYLGNENDPGILIKYINKGFMFILGVGDNKSRSELFKIINSSGGIVKTIIHPKSIISNDVKIGKGVFVSKNSVINPLCKISNNCIINTSTTIEHGCYISESVHVAPGTVLLGNVKIGKNSFIGSNSTIKQGTRVGNNVIIGAGSVVLNDVPDNKVCFGNPAKNIK
jgi:sugar O-acyltransferase (sialic acid O-acetyltransferase NeuD family)